MPSSVHHISRHSYKAAPAARVPARRGRTVVAAAALDPSGPHIQLATAKLPSKVNEPAFTAALYQHVATLTQNGKNLPFVLPLRVDRLKDGGFQLGLLRRGEGGAFAPALEIVGTVETVEEVGRVLFMRLYEGEAAFAGRPYNGPPEDRLEAVIQGHPDVDTIMGTMVPAIRKAAVIAQP